jgi:hypothetical protein
MHFEAPTRETIDAVASAAIWTSFASEPTPMLSYDPRGIQGEIPVHSGKIVNCVYRMTVGHCYDQTRTSLIVSDAARFQQYIQSWRIERGATSSIPEMVMCRSHLLIIAMGPRIALPLIFTQMESEGDEPDMWFVALQVLTHADPVTDEIRGDFKAMADRWLQWALDNGYAW